MKCLKCGADVPVDSTSRLCPICFNAQSERRFKLLLGVCVGALAVLVFFAIALTIGLGKIGRNADQPPSAGGASPTESSQNQTTVSSTPDHPHWVYNALQTDAGTKTIRFGCIQSDEMVHLNSPHMDAFARLCLRTDGAVLLILNGEGQLLSGEGHDATIRFGNGPPDSFSLEQPADYSTNSAFIEPASPLFAAAEAGKKITIEATYYKAGEQTVSFTPPEPLKLK